MPNDTRPTVDAILADPAAYGIGFEEQTLKHEKMELPAVPVVVHLDLDKVRDTFGPAMILAAMNGTSWRVTDQRIARDMVWKNRSVPTDTIKRRQIEARFGVRAPAVRPKYWQGMDGKEYATLEAAQQASVAFLVDLGVPSDVAIAKVKEAIK